MIRTINDFMVRAVITADPEDTIGEVQQIMSQHDISALPVVESSGGLRGIISADDLVSGYESSLPISRIMTTPVRTLPPTANVREGARQMRELHQHHVVVVDDDRVVGILSTFDLLRLVELHG